MKEEEPLPLADPINNFTGSRASYRAVRQNKASAASARHIYMARGSMKDISREEFEQVRETLIQTRERMAAGEAIQSRHDDAIQILSQQIAELSEETRRGIADIKGQIIEANTGKAKILYGAISAGGTIGGGIAVGLYQLIHAIYPHLFGG